MSSKSAPFQILRVKPGGKVKPGILAAQRLILQGGGQITAAADHTHHALVGQPAEQLLPIRVKLGIVIMGVSVKNRSVFHKSNSFIKKSDRSADCSLFCVF